MALGKVHLVAHAVLADLHGPRCGGLGFVEGRGLDPLEAPEVVVDLDAGKFRSRQLVQERQPPREPLGHPEAEDLAKEHVRVPVDREPAHAVAVRIEQAVGVGLRIELEDSRRSATALRMRLLEVFLAHRLGRVDDDPERILARGLNSPDPARSPFLS